MGEFTFKDIRNNLLLLNIGRNFQYFRRRLSCCMRRLVWRVIRTWVTCCPADCRAMVAVRERVIINLGVSRCGSATTSASMLVDLWVLVACASTDGWAIVDTDSGSSRGLCWDNPISMWVAADRSTGRVKMLHRQIGQVSWFFSHSSMHFEWNLCCRK